MPLLNYTTKIDADKTASEIARCLSMHGAQAVLTEYDKESSAIIAISFQIELEGQKFGFRLPCDWKPVYAVMTRGKRVQSRWEAEYRAQAVRTAWRIVKDWVEAQMALVETKMVNTQTVFLPYVVMKNGRTLAENVANNPSMLLGDGS